MDSRITSQFVNREMKLNSGGSLGYACYSYRLGALIIFSVGWYFCAVVCRRHAQNHRVIVGGLINFMRKQRPSSKKSRFLSHDGLWTIYSLSHLTFREHLPRASDDQLKLAVPSDGRGWATREVP